MMECRLRAMIGNVSSSLVGSISDALEAIRPAGWIIQSRSLIGDLSSQPINVRLRCLKLALDRQYDQRPGMLSQMLIWVGNIDVLCSITYCRLG